MRALGARYITAGKSTTGTWKLYSIRFLWNRKKLFLRALFIYLYTVPAKKIAPPVKFNAIVSKIVAAQ
jgi:hypothetical protein